MAGEDKMADNGQHPQGERATEEKQRLIRLLEQTRQESIEILRGVDDRAVVHPETGWRAQDVLGHLAAWEREVLASIQAFSENDSYTLGDDYRLELYNEETYQRRRHFDPMQCRMDWGMVRRDLQFAVHDVPDDRFFEPMRFPWRTEGTVSKLVEEMVDHEKEHLAQIRDALARDD